MKPSLPNAAPLAVEQQCGRAWSPATEGCPPDECKSAEIAHHVVTAKTELEKIRGQAQNIE